MAAVDPWVAVALAAAVAQAGYEILQKRLTSDVDTLELSYVTAALGTALLVAPAGWLAATRAIAVTPRVAVATLVAGSANVLALYAFLSALDRAGLSVVSPLRQSTPLLVALLEPAVLATALAPEIVAGAVAATVGGYVILADESLTSPLARVTDPGPLLALATAGLYAVASVAARFAVVRIPSLSFTFLLYLQMAAAFALLLWYRDGTVPGRALLERRFLALGGLTTLRSVLIFAAFALVAAAQATIVLRVSLVLTVLAGGTLFGERGLWRRLAGAALVIAGVALAV